MNPNNSRLVIVFATEGPTMPAPVKTERDLSPVGYTRAEKLEKELRNRNITPLISIVSSAKCDRQIAGIILNQKKSDGVRCVELLALGMPKGDDGEFLTDLFERWGNASLLDYFPFDVAKQALRRFGETFVKSLECDERIQQTFNELDPSILVVGPPILIPAAAAQFCKKYSRTDDSRKACQKVVLGYGEAILVEIDNHGCSHVEPIRLD